MTEPHIPFENLPIALKTLQTLGARSGDRTRMALRPRDFKSLASTSFATQAAGIGGCCEYACERRES